MQFSESSRHKNDLLHHSMPNKDTSSSINVRDLPVPAGGERTDWETTEKENKQKAKRENNKNKNRIKFQSIVVR